jgi:hypothetical protein
LTCYASLFSVLSYISLQLSSLCIHTNFGTDKHEITLTSFGLIDIDLSGWEVNTTVGSKEKPYHPLDFFLRPQYNSYPVSYKKDSFILLVAYASHLCSNWRNICQNCAFLWLVLQCICHTLFSYRPAGTGSTCVRPCDGGVTASR